MGRKFKISKYKNIELCQVYDKGEESFEIFNKNKIYLKN